MYKTHISLSCSLPLVVRSVKDTILEDHFCREVSAIEESLMQIRGAVTLVTIALKGAQRWRGIQTRGRPEGNMWASLGMV